MTERREVNRTKEGMVKIEKIEADRKKKNRSTSTSLRRHLSVSIQDLPYLMAATCF